MSSFFPKSTQPPRIHWVHVALPRGASLPACEEHRRQATSGRPGLVGSGCPRPLLGRDVEFVAGPVVGGWGGLCRVLALVGWAGLLGAPSRRLASDLPEVEGAPLGDAPPCTSSPCLTVARLGLSRCRIFC